MKNNERVLKLMALNSQAKIIIEQVKPIRDEILDSWDSLQYYQYRYFWDKQLIAREKKDFIASLRKQSLLLGKLAKVNDKRKQYRFKQTSKQITLFKP